MLVKYVNVKEKLTNLWYRSSAVLSHFSEYHPESENALPLNMSYYYKFLAYNVQKDSEETTLFFSIYLAGLPLKSCSGSV